MKQDAASTGSTEVAAAGFAAPPPEAEESKDATELKISAGGVLSAGNSRSLAFTSAGDFRLRRGDDQLSVAVAGNYGRSRAARGEPMQTTVENLQGRVRYDRFVTEHLALFFATSARRDRFQGLDLRLNLDPGFAYYFIDEKESQFWSELGYDLQYDVRRDDALDAAAAEGQDLDKTDLRHSARAFLGYKRSLNGQVHFSTGLEYLLGLPETDYWRLNWDAALSASVGGAFSIATTVSLKYDHHPLPLVEELDALTAVNLVYALQ